MPCKVRGENIGVTVRLDNTPEDWVYIYDIVNGKVTFGEIVDLELKLFLEMLGAV
jgi:hypothetical protein